MKAKYGVSYSIKHDGNLTLCETCRKILKNEPYAVRYQEWYNTRVIVDKRCWRCWHGREITEGFMDKYPEMFKREKIGRWYHLSLAQEWLSFPSSSGEHEPDY